MQHTPAPTLLCRADHCVVVLVGAVVVRLHLHAVLSPKHLGVLAILQEVLVVQLQVPQCQTVLLHPQGLKLQRCREKSGEESIRLYHFVSDSQ